MLWYPARLMAVQGDPDTGQKMRPIITKLAKVSLLVRDYDEAIRVSIEDHRRARRTIEKHCQETGCDPSQIDISHNATMLIAEDRKALDAVHLQEIDRRGLSVDDYRASLGNAIVGTPEERVA